MREVVRHDVSRADEGVRQMARAACGRTLAEVGATAAGIPPLQSICTGSAPGFRCWCARQPRVHDVLAWVVHPRKLVITASVAALQARGPGHLAVMCGSRKDRTTGRGPTSAG